MQAQNPWENITDDTIKSFILGIWEEVDRGGWDQPSSIRHVRIKDGELVSDHPTFFGIHPAEFLEGRHASRHTDAVLAFFEGWTYPEPLTREEMEEQGALIRPSDHPRRVELRQALFMARNGLTYSALQRRGDQVIFERVNVPGDDSGKEIAGIITHAVRCYLQAPYHKDIPDPYITWLRNVVGQTLSGVIEYATENNASQQDITMAAQDVAMLIDLGLEPEKGQGSPALQIIEGLKERHHAPEPTSTWSQVRDRLILDAYLSQQSSRVRALKWLDDAALQESLDDLEVSNKARSLLALLDDPTTKDYLESTLAKISID